MDSAVLAALIGAGGTVLGTVLGAVLERSASLSRLFARGKERKEKGGGASRPISLTGRWKYKRLAQDVFPDGELIHGGTVDIVQTEFWWGVTLEFTGQRKWEQKGRRGKVTRLEQIVLWKGSGRFVAANEIEFEYQTDKSYETFFKGTSKCRVHIKNDIDIIVTGHFNDLESSWPNKHYSGGFELHRLKPGQSELFEDSVE
jgi:hypothetical protein